MPLQFIRPCWWYLVVSIPLAATWLVSNRYLEPKSYEYSFGGLRNSIVLGAVNFAELIGLVALTGFGIFVCSAFNAKFHNARAQKLFSAAALILYGVWSLFMAVWIMMK